MIRYTCAGLVLLGVLLLTPMSTMAQNPVPCTRPFANPEGIDGQDQTISLTPVLIFRPHTGVCSWIVSNTSATDAIRCRSINDGMVSATSGQKIGPGGAWSMGTEGQSGLRCIRDQSATADVITSSTWVLP